MTNKTKQKKCKYCLDKFTPKYSTEPCWKYNCRMRLLSDKREKIYNASIKRAKEGRLTYVQRVAKVKAVFQAWIRSRDAELNCISCNATTSNPHWHGGHYKKAETYSGVIFNEFNVNKQCHKCNVHNNGNELNYRIGLIAKIGIEDVLGIEQLAQETRFKKYSDLELIEIKEKYKAKIKDFIN